MIFSIRHLGGTLAAKLIDIEVHPLHRGNGYGRTAVQWLMALATSRGAAYLKLFVFDHRERARNLYQKLGFEVVATRSNGKVMKYLLSP